MDHYLIKYASPTLGGIKTGSLFKISKNAVINLNEVVQTYNLLLNPLDLYIEIIYSCDKYDLIYVYRLNMLLSDFKDEKVKEFLKFYGYECIYIKDYLAYLKRRFNLLKKTPHEVGVFLGYPLNDVKNFIKYKGKNFKYSGCWKVYDDMENCIKKFEELKEYKAEFNYLYNQNYSLTDLILSKKPI